MAFPVSIKPKGRTRSVAGKMNGLEEAYAARLQLLLNAGQIAWFKWDCMSLRLAESTHHRTDFLVMQKDGTLEVHETKGSYMDDKAWIKYKLIVEMYPFPFFLVRKTGRKGAEVWDITEVGVDAKAAVHRAPKEPKIPSEAAPARSTKPGPRWPGRK